ncbi:MAG: TetR/AcrR family transcriptional regulator [Rhodothermales bacterium]|nr:TetR/AcrR family transcriptional regulator [Rhodothermales bacterium]
MEVAALSRRERERLERRRAMLDAAKAVFADKGYEHATLDEVAERAEFGKGTLYNYFPGGKEEILFTLFKNVFEGMAGVVRDHFAGVPEGTPVREAFRALTVRLVDHFTENRSTFHLLIKEAQRLMLTQHEQVAELHRLRDRAIEELVPTIEHAIARGELRPLPPLAVAHMYMGNVKGYLMYANPNPACEAAPAAFATPEEAADFITSILFDGLLPRD